MTEIGLKFPLVAMTAAVNNPLVFWVITLYFYHHYSYAFEQIATMSSQHLVEGFYQAMIVILGHCQNLKSTDTGQ